MSNKTFKQLLEEEKPLRLVAVHDALSAQLVELAGFKAYSIGVFGLIGVRYRLPDVGIASFGEIAEAMRDTMRGSSLPVMVDGDDGYGDVKNVTRTVEVYEEMGVAGIVFEDQTNPKRCGHMAGKSVVSIDQAKRKLEAALAARKNPDLFIIARTDARAVHGLDDALKRGEEFLKLGVDGLFVEAPQSIEELEIIGRSFNAPLVVNMAAGGRTPILPPEELVGMGYSIVLYAGTMLFRAAKAMQETVATLKKGEIEPDDCYLTFKEMTDMFGLPKWAAIDDKYSK
ncbi:MAG: isocitrate lyase/PEP mutase family protein [Desulfobacteraceae bacterium]|nr:isocitrate lyase/PEP mutase family protein [Desulfobacteraceae bacterium]